MAQTKNKYIFTLCRYNNYIDKVLIESKDITIYRTCPFVAKEYLMQKYIDSKLWHFCERK